ncbi:MAG: MmgE/PrpD family protein, partial [Deltaproteobacteria bacterium]|nr:MmgE/PrpD family protein [Deltaproteobacteria bacterium]
MMEIERKLVQNLIKIKYEDLPERVVEMAKMTILDTLGALIGGVGAEGCLPLVNQLREWAGVQESTIMIYGGKVPCPNAAFANSVMARALELDSPRAPGIHVSASTVPVSIATAEKCRPVGGKELISSIVLGEDFTARVNHAVSSYRGFDPTGVCTVLGATATAGRILGLDEQKMWNALAIAFNRSAGSFHGNIEGLDEQKMWNALAIAFNRSAGSFHGNIEGALTVRLIQGLSSRSGIESALISMAGITGGRNFLVGKWGFFDLFSDGQFNRKAITAQLGKRFEGAYGITFKRYPSCGATLSATEATLELVHKYDIKPDYVEEVTVELPPFYYDLVGHKFKIGDNPTVDAQFSIQYVVANS